MVEREEEGTPLDRGLEVFFLDEVEDSPSLATGQRLEVDEPDPELVMDIVIVLLSSLLDVTPIDGEGWQLVVDVLNGQDGGDVDEVVCLFSEILLLFTIWLEEILIKAISDPLINDRNFSLSELLSGGRLRPVDLGVTLRPIFPDVAMFWDMTH